MLSAARLPPLAGSEALDRLPESMTTLESLSLKDAKDDEKSIGSQSNPEERLIKLHSREIVCIDVESVSPHGPHKLGEDRNNHFEGRSLFVGDLPNDANENDVYELFSKAGEIHSVDIKKDRVTGNNRGYGFVVFKFAQDAAKAKETLNNTRIRGRAIRIGWAQKNARLFVALLPEGVTTKSFTELMEGYGPIIRDDTHLSTHGFGFVRYQHRADAERARSVIDSGNLICRRADGTHEKVKVRVGWGDEQTQRNCVHIQFDPKQGQSAEINDEDLRHHFEQFGSVVKASTPRHTNQFLKGYGFVHFVDSPQGEQCAARAILNLDGIKVREVVWKCNFGKRKRDRKLQETARRRNSSRPSDWSNTRQLRHSRHQLSSRPQTRPLQSNLYRDYDLSMISHPFLFHQHYPFPNFVARDRPHPRMTLAGTDYVWGPTRPSSPTPTLSDLTTVAHRGLSSLAYHIPTAPSPHLPQPLSQPSSSGLVTTMAAQPPPTPVVTSDVQTSMTLANSIHRSHSPWQSIQYCNTEPFLQAAAAVRVQSPGLCLDLTQQGIHPQE